MTIKWFGHSCFRIESKELSLVIDPFSKEIGLRPPRLARDSIILKTHEHYDHNNTEGASLEAFIIEGPGEYEKAGVQVEGINSFHDDQEGKLRGMNTIYVIGIEDMRICHLGDFGQTELTHEQAESIGNIDVLFIPVGGKYTIDAKAAVKVIKQIDPKIIIPMHYKIPGLKLDIDDNKKFIKEISIKPEEVESLKINAKTLPVEETRLITFKP